MKTIKLSELKKQYEFVCDQYIQKFSNKQGIEFDGWIGKDIGGVASFIDQYFFNLSDIIEDINGKHPKGLILEWQDDSVDYNMARKDPFVINYKTYAMGLRYSDL